MVAWSCICSPYICNFSFCSACSVQSFSFFGAARAFVCMLLLCADSCVLVVQLANKLDSTVQQLGRPPLPVFVQVSKPALRIWIHLAFLFSSWGTSLESTRSAAARVPLFHSGLIAFEKILLGLEGRLACCTVCICTPQIAEKSSCETRLYMSCLQAHAQSPWL